MRKLFILCAVLLAIAGGASAQAVAHGVTLSSTTNATSYTSGSFTPASGDLLVVAVLGRQTLTRPGTLTDSQSGSWTQILAVDGSVTADTMYLFVRTTTVSASSMTVTFDCTGDSATGAIIFVARVSGLSRTGASAIRQYKTISAQAAATPAVTFDASTQTGNPTIAVTFNQTNPATLTEPSGWTERADTGFTGTTITWGSSSSSVWGALIVEMDASATGGAAARRMIVN